jgi:hypothetical protein
MHRPRTMSARSGKSANCAASSRFCGALLHRSGFWKPHEVACRWRCRRTCIGRTRTGITSAFSLPAVVQRRVMCRGSVGTPSRIGRCQQLLADPRRWLSMSPTYARARTKLRRPIDFFDHESARSTGSRRTEDEDADPVMLGFLSFLQKQMAEHPELIEPADQGAGCRVHQLARCEEGHAGSLSAVLSFRLQAREGSCLCWFNDEDTLRKAGAKSDVYEVFRRMLIRGQVPTSLEELPTQSTALGDLLHLHSLRLPSSPKNPEGHALRCSASRRKQVPIVAVSVCGGRRSSRPRKARRLSCRHLLPPSTRLTARARPRC